MPKMTSAQKKVRNAQDQRRLFAWLRRNGAKEVTATYNKQAPPYKAIDGKLYHYTRCDAWIGRREEEGRQRTIKASGYKLVVSQPRNAAKEAERLNRKVEAFKAQLKAEGFTVN